MVEVRVLLGTTWLPVLLQVLLRMLKMVRASGVTPSYRTLLEMALENVASTERVFAQMALIGSLAGVCGTSVAWPWLGENKQVLTSQQMALQMLQVEVRLVAVRTLILALCVLRGSRWRLACGRSRPPGVGRQNTTSTLLANHVQWLRFLVREHRSMWI